MIRTLCRMQLFRLPVTTVTLPRLTICTPRLQFHSTRLALQDEHHKPEPKVEETAEAKKGEEKKAESAKENGEKKAEVKKTAEQLLLEKQAAEIEELKKKYLTSLADMQNLRTRTSNDVTAAKKFGGQEFAKSMLEVADNLSLALKAAAADATEANPKLKIFFEGVTMTQTSLLKAFEQNQVTQMKALGEKFDPNLHMSLYQFEDPTKVPGTVGNVMKEGYKIADRVLRAAQVGTVKAPAQPVQPKPEEPREQATPSA